MSRTYRCANGRPLEYFWVRPNSTMMRRLHRVFGDRRRWARGTSKEFRHMLESIKRAKNREELRMAIAYPDEDIVFTPRKRDAEWEAF